MTELEKRIVELKIKCERMWNSNTDSAAAAFGLSVLLNEALEIINEQQKIGGKCSK